MSPAYPKPEPRKRAEPEPIPEGARLAVEARSAGMCEGCGLRRATEVHHRKFRSRGGDNAVENLLHLCGSGNHSGCHGAAHGSPPTPERCSAIGWAVRADEDPLAVPVIYRGRLRHLTADGVAITPEQYERETTR
ncbi:hypothetical protein GTU73_08920 [Rathayibacter sp. VKM Ac-2804]|uniref:HNH endonuclease n=1 Tax=Rathayibacter sp. VKM Ac-2804 TaxID=2609257 RepID=UPI00132ED011|nr:HNH endonuclease signature motif containing protein [Rathayibacter sp. VKM Ac-2804]QHF24120.1 hypothetical protein GTU73_08920 [Rathayibacter sp. VKM Ac-2804]